MLSSKRYVILLMLSFVLSAGCGDSNEGSPGASHGSVKAPVVTAEETLSPIIHEAVGTIQAKTAGTVSAQLMGTVRNLHVKEGDRVKAGDLLVTIDTRQVSAQLDQARAAVSEARRAAAAADAAREAAQANADLANATFERYEKLLAQESVSRQEYDEVTSRRRQAQSALKQAEEMARAARYRVKQTESGLSSASVFHEDAKVKAPFDGFIGRKLIEPGDLATPGKPLLTLESTSGFEMAMDIPEAYYQSIQSGQEIQLRIDALNGQMLTGRISAVSPTADVHSRSFLVKVDLPENAPVLAGMFARAEIPIGKEQLMLVPAEAVIHEGHLTGMFMLDEHNIARFRLVRTGRSIDGAVEIISGLKPGTRFVDQPPPVLEDGMKVEAAS